MSGKTWSNWAGTQTCVPSTVHQPADAGEVGRIVRDAVASGSTVRPLGAGHSFTPVAVTDGHRVQLDKMTGFVGSDADAGTVTLQAGTRLRDVPGILRPRGLALANQGDVDPQALAGAVSTGTHGTGLGFTGFAGMVKGFRIVGADGEEVHAYDGAPGTAGDLFRLGRLSLGIFGVITELTLEGVPAFRLSADEHAENVDEVRRTFPERVAAVDHMEFYWFPGTDLALVKENTRLPGVEGMESANDPGLLGRAGEFIADEVINNAGLLALCEAAKAAPKLTRKLNAFAAKTVSTRRYVDEAHKVFVSPRRVRFSEMEYAVPLDSLPEVLDEVRRTIDRHHAWVSFPLEIRAAKGDDVALSTAYGRDSAYIAVHRYHREEYREYFDLLEPIFLAAGGRPHWGKLHTLGAEQLRERYPLFDDVAQLRRRLDPNGVFLNDHLRGLFEG
ncbi:MAG: D-arabinono-1,4-lactone oxidase [Corynebacterium sp.]|nr:D-arabinono-1,4-lactone oxidase [Corynebacterium sp.]